MATNFDAMSRDELLNWIDTNGTAELLASGSATRLHGVRFVEVDGDGEPVAKQPVTMRLAPEMIRELDARAGRDKDGRSGIVRAAVEEYFRNHPRETAA